MLVWTTARTLLRFMCSLVGGSTVATAPKDEQYEIFVS